MTAYCIVYETTEDHQMFEKVMPTIEADQRILPLRTAAARCQFILVDDLPA